MFNICRSPDIEDPPKQGADANYEAMIVNQKLQAALDLNFLSSAKEFLEQGADANYEVKVNISGSDYTVPLTFVILRKKDAKATQPIFAVDKLSLLFDYGAKVDYKSKTLGTLLECTDDYDDDYVTLFLLRQKADPFLRADPDGFNFFEMSLNNKRSTIVEEIIKLYPKKSQENLDEYIFHFAYHHDEYNILSFVLECGADPFRKANPEEFNFFEISLNDKKLSTVEKIMRSYPEESQENLDEYIFRFVDNNDEYNILPFVLECGADPFKINGNGRSFLEHCIARGKFNLIDEILTSTENFIFSLFLSFILDDIDTVRHICRRLSTREDKDEILEAFYEKIKVFEGRKDVRDVIKEI